MTERGTLNEGEYHPAADSAFDYLKSLGYMDLIMWLESFSSCAIEGNRLGEVCSETLSRLMEKEPVSDRYLLGLAWTIKTMKEETDNGSKPTRMVRRRRVRKEVKKNKGGSLPKGRRPGG